MKHLLKAALTFIAVTFFITSFAQNTGAYLKYDLNGKTISHKGEELNNYNVYEPGEGDTRPCNEHVLYLSYVAKAVYKMDIKILTPPHTVPVAGKLPYVQTVYSPNAPCPAVHISVTKQEGDEYAFYAAVDENEGHFEITKVAAGWVEGKFDIELPLLFADGEVLHITNGSFRFKIEKESKN